MKNNYQLKSILTSVLTIILLVGSNMIVAQPCAVPPTSNAGSNSSVCAGINYTLTGSIGGSATSGTWSTSGTGTFNPSDVFGTATSYTPSAADITAGSVVISLTTDDPDGAGDCVPAVSSLTLTINAVPAAPVITPSGATTFCNGSSVDLTSSYVTGNVWAPGGATTQTITVTTSGSYTVTYTDGTTGCSATSAPTAVTVNTGSANITPAGPVSLCTGGSTTLTANSSTDYLWSPGGETTQAITVSSAGTYTVQTTSANGCTATASVTVSVNAFPTASITGPSIICTGVTTTLNSNATAGSGTIASYQWILNGSTNLGSAATQNATSAGSYTVTVTNSAGCSFTSAPFVVTVSGPLSGTYTIGAGPASCTNYLTFAAAISDLNTKGISGNVIFNVAPGYSETVPSGGLILKQCGLAANLKSGPTQSITFQNTGGSPHPMLIAFTPATGTFDGVVKIVGTDNVTFDGIDVSENGANSGMEMGYGVFKCDINDGSVGVTITNCNVTLNKANTSSIAFRVANVTETNTTPTGTLTTDPVAIWAARNRVNITNNIISNVYMAALLNGNGASGSANDSANVISNNTITNFGGGTATCTVINPTDNRYFSVSNNNINGGAGTNAALTGINGGSGPFGAITGNTVSLVSTALTTSAVIGITYGASGTNNNGSITGNVVQNCSFTGATSATFTGITSGLSGTASTITVSNNNVINNSINGTGTFIGIQNSSNPTTFIMSNNTVNGNTKTSSGTFTGLNLSSTTSGMTATISNNTVDNNLITAATSGTTACGINGILTPAGVYTVSGNTITNNRVTGIQSTAIATLTGIGTNSTTTTSETITNNKIQDLFVIGTGASTALHAIRGINFSTSTSSTRIISGDTISNLYSNAGVSSSVTGIITGTIGTGRVFQNRIFNLFAGQSGTTGAFIKGISNTSGTTVTIYNNMISLDLSQAFSPAGNNVLSGGDAVKGIEVTGGTNINLYFNTVLLNGGGSGGAFGSSGIGITSTTPVVDIRNNIIENFMTGGGSTAAACATALRRSSATLTSYSTASNNNIWYVAGNALSPFYYDGATAYISLATFKAFVSTRESNSKSENVNFLSTSGSSPDLFKVNTTIATNVEGGAQSISGITGDYFGTVRNTSSPDIGAHEGNFINLNMVISSNSASPATGQCSAVNHIITTIVTPGANPVASVSLSYSFNGSAGAGSPIAMTNTTGDTWTATIPAATPANANVTWTVTATDNAANTVSSVGLSYQDAYLLGQYSLSASANPASVCSGGNSQLSAQLLSLNTTSYTVSANTLSPVSTAGLTPGTFSTVPTGDDVISNSLNIGFNFSFFGNVYSSFVVSTNGNIQFGNPPTSASWTQQTIPNSTTPTSGGNTGVNNYIALAWKDWTSVTSGEINYYTTGVSPNRICIIDFNDVGNFAGQIILHETSNIIDIIATNIPTNTSVQGIENLNGTVGYASPGRNNVSWSSTTPSSYTFTPGNGTVFTYLWSPNTFLSSTTTANTQAQNMTTGATPTTITYNVTASDVNGCSVSATVPVTVNPLPAAPTGTNSTQCGIGTPTASVSGVSGFYRWYLTPTGGSALSGQNGSTLVTYPISVTTDFYVSEYDGTCESARTQVTATVTNPDAVTAQSSVTTICPFTNFDLSVLHTGNANNYTYSWTASPVTGSGIQTSLSGTPITIQATTGGTFVYTVTATDATAGCATSSTVSVTITNPPVITTSVASPTTVCAGSAATLTAYTTAPTIGTATTLTGDITQPTAFCNRWEQYWCQLVYTAAELQSAGLQAGPINSITFYINTIGSANNVFNFRVSLGPIGTTTLTGFTTTGLTQVYGPAVYNQTIGANTINFSTPYVWDGISNILVDLKQGGADLTNNSQTYYTATSGNTVVYATTGATPPPDFTTTNPTASTSTQRFNITFNGPFGGQGVGYYNWQWSPGSLPSGNVASVNPTTTTIYTIQATDPATGCSNYDTAIVNVNPVPAAPTATNSVQCGTGVPTASVTGGGNLYRWYLVSSGGTPITGESLDHLTNYSISTTTTFYVSEYNGQCEGSRVAVLATVNSPDPITALSSSPTCVNESVTLNVTQTGSSNVYVYSWTANPSTGSGISSPMSGNTITITPSITGTYIYSVTGFDANTQCTAVSQVSVTVGNHPTITSATASPNPVCSGSTVTLTGLTGSTGPINATIGTATTLTSATNQPTAFCNRWEQYWCQMVYTAAELQAAGLIAGPINAITFKINTIGDANNVFNFRVSLGPVATSTLTGFTTTGLTQVYGPATYNQQIGFNTITFTTPYMWNGTSNILVELIQGGADALNNSETYYTATSGNTVVTATSGNTPPPDFTTTNPSATTSNQRLNIIFAGTQSTIGAGAYNWQWGPGSLSAGNVATANPTANTIYVVTATDPASGCSTTASVPVSINTLPATPTATPSTQCGYGIPTASVSGGIGIFRWYTTPTGGTPIAGESNDHLMNTYISTTTTFYVADYDGTCESERVAVVATVTNPDAVTAGASVSFGCTNQPITLTATQTGSTNTYSYTWSATPATGSGITGTVSGASVSVSPTAVGTYTYSVVATDAGANCATISTVSISVNQSPTITVTPTSTTVCPGTPTQLQATQTNGAGMAYSFNGTGQYIAVAQSPSIDLTSTAGNGITLEAWVYEAAFPTASPGDAGIISHYQTSTNASYFLRTNETSPYSGLGAGASTATTTANGTMSLNTWTHVAAVFSYNGTTSNDSVKIYKNGVLLASGVSVVPHTNDSLRIASDFGGRYWNGQIDEVRIWKGAVSAATINSWMNRSITNSHPNYDSLMAYYNFDAISNTTVADLSGHGNTGYLRNGPAQVVSTAPIANVTSYAWSPSTGLSDATISNPIATVNSLTTYTVTVTGTNGCIATGSSTIDVFSTQPAPTPHNSTQCGVGVPTASVTGGGGVYRWYLTPTGGTPLSGENQDHLTAYSITSTTTFYVAEYDGSCESTRATVVATVTDPDPLTLTPSPNPVCGNAPLTLTATQTGTNNTYMYTWSSSPTPGSGLTGSETGASIVITPTVGGTYVYSVTGTDAGAGCAALATVSVTVTAPPVISSSSATPSTICPGTSVSLAATSQIIGTGPQSLPATYCVPSQLGSACITSVIFNTLNSTPATCTSPYYRINPYSGSTTTTLTAGQTYSMTLATSASSIISVWIDYDRSGTFDASEWVQPWTNATSGTINIIVPANAQPGATGLRIRSRSNGNANGATDACNTGFGSGSTEDYTVNILSDVPNPDISFAWNPGSLSGSPVTVNPTTTTTYIVTATSASTGCTSTASVPVTVISSSGTPVAQASSLSLCGPGSVTLSVATPVSALTYQWQQSSSGNMGTWTNISTGSSINSGTISADTYFRVYETCGTSSDTSTSILVSVVNPSISGVSSGSRCGAGQVTLSVTGTGSFDWYAASSGGTALATNTATYSPFVTATTTYWVQAYIGSCLDPSGRHAVTATVTPSPSVTVTSLNGTTICQNQTLTLTATSSNDPNYTYNWSLNGSTSVATGAQYVSTPSVSETVYLYAVDNTTGTNAGCGALVITSITVNPAPATPAVSQSLAVACAPGQTDTLRVTNVPPTANGYTMNTNCSTGFIDISGTGTSIGTIDDDSETNITFPAAFSFNGTTYTAARIGNNGVIALGSTTGEIVFTNAALPSTSNSAGNVLLCPFWDDLDIQTSAVIYTQLVGNTIIIQYNSMAHNDFITGSITFEAQLNIVTGEITFVYPDVIFGNAAQDAGASATIGIQMSSTSAVQYSFNTASLTNGQCISFSPIPAVTYSWSPATGLNQTTGSTVVATPTATTTYTVVATNGLTGCTSSSNVTVVYDAVATPTITANGPTSFCQGGSVTLDAGAGYTNYSWSDGSTVVGTSQTYVASPSATTTYTVTVSNGGACSASASQTVTIQPLAPPTITTNKPATICQGDSVTLDAGSGYTEYSWFNGASVVGTNQTYVAYNGALYTVTVTAGNGCTATASVQVTVNPNPPPAVVTPSGPLTLCADGSDSPITLTADTTGTGDNGFILWNDLFGATGPTYDVYFNDINFQGNTYDFNVSVSNSFGCTSVSNSVTVNVITCGTGMTVNLKLFLQGYYTGSNTMQPVLLNQAVPGATSTQTDTITVELRSSTNAANVVTTAQPILNTDGSVSFSTTAPAGYYWIAVRHRNTVETWSADTVQLPGPVYDFTTAANKAFGDNQIDALGDLKYSMYTGDVNQDDFIDIFDFPDYDLDNQNFVAFEYKATDFNGDGFVDIFDFPIYDANNQNFIFSIQP